MRFAGPDALAHFEAREHRNVSARRLAVCDQGCRVVGGERRDANTRRPSPFTSVRLRSGKKHFAHPGVATSLDGLAKLYRAQEHHTKAEPPYARALSIWEKALGPEHPNVAKCLENYALCLRATDRSQEAVPLEARARAIRLTRSAD
jgi:hypothetical protein